MEVNLCYQPTSRLALVGFLVEGVSFAQKDAISRSDLVLLLRLPAAIMVGSLSDTHAPNVSHCVLER